MTLSMEMMYCAGRIIGDRRRSGGGLERGPLGTGFCVTVPSARLPSVRYGYLLTAHHVIAAQSDVEVEMPDPFAEGQLSPPIRITDWRQPLDGVDFALAPFRVGVEHTNRVVAIELEESVLPQRHVPQLGAPIFYIGLLEPDDRPMARSGTIGALDQVGLRFQEGYSYRAHLIDCRSYRGFSGSPCFLSMRFASLEPTTPPVPVPDEIEQVGLLFHLSLLCGMFTAHRNDQNEDGTISRYGVGVMLRSVDIWRALMSREMSEERATWDAQAAADEPPAFESASAGSAPNKEFDRFQELTGKLLRVPKEELDEKRERKD